MKIIVSKEDVLNVLDSYSCNADINEVMEIIDDDEIVRKSENKEDVYNYIAKQLYKNGYLKIEQIEEYGNIDIIKD